VKEKRRRSADKATADEGRLSLSLTRRSLLKGAGLAGLTVASPLMGFAGDIKKESADGTPEQIHLTYGDDPASTVFVSWASKAQATNPRVIVQSSSGKKTVVHGIQKTYTDGLNGQTVFTYHAKLEGLNPGSTLDYAVTQDPAKRAGTFPLDELRRSGDAGDEVDALLGAKPVCGAGGREIPTTLSSFERRSVLCQFKPRGAARSLERFWQQRASLRHP